MAEACPDWNFVLVGEDALRGTWRSIFSEFPNLLLLGNPRAQDLHAIRENIDVAIFPLMPTAGEPIAEVPENLSEFVTLKKPVIVTDIPKALQAAPHLVHASDSHGEFVRQLKETHP
jgi:hypothetical protein